MITKFRAKKDNISDSSFVYGDLIYSEDGTPRILTDRKELLFITCLKGTEGMSTGLKDKSGKEIFGGDVVRVFEKFNEHLIERTHPEIIEWIGTQFYRTTTDKDMPEHAKAQSLYEGEEYEVIGNIFGNPELLEASK